MIRDSCSSGVGEAADRAADRRDLALGHRAEHGLDQVVLGVEVVVDEARADVELVGDVDDPQLVQALREGDVVRRLDDLAAALIGGDAGAGRGGHRRAAYRGRAPAPGGRPTESLRRTWRRATITARRRAPIARPAGNHVAAADVASVSFHRSDRGTRATPSSSCPVVLRPGRHRRRPCSRRPSPPRAVASSGENGTIQLVRTTTLAAYHDGVERYVTSFEFTGEGESVGSIVPLPDVPTSVERGGDWTLQRLAQEVAPPRLAAESAAERRRPRRPTSRSSSRRRSTPSTSRCSRAAATRSGVGRSTTASSCRRTRRRCSTSTRPAAPCSWPPSSTPSGPVISGRVSATARRSWPRSRPTTRGCRCASSGSASRRSGGSRPTCSCSPTPSRSCSPAGPGLTVERSEAASAGLLADLRSDVGMEWVPAADVAVVPAARRRRRRPRLRPRRRGRPGRRAVDHRCRRRAGLRRARATAGAGHALVARSSPVSARPPRCWPALTIRTRQHRPGRARELRRCGSPSRSSRAASSPPAATCSPRPRTPRPSTPLGPGAGDRASSTSSTAASCPST